MFLVICFSFISSQEITFSQFYIENTTLCNDDISFIEIIPYDSNQNPVSIDNLEIKFSLNISYELLESFNKDSYDIKIINITNNETLFLDIIGYQRGKVINEQASFQIVQCHTFRLETETKLDKFGIWFIDNWFYLVIGITIVGFLIILIVILKLASKE